MPEPTKKPTDEQLRKMCCPGNSVYPPEWQAFAAELLELRTTLHAARITHAEELVVLLQLLKGKPLLCDHMEFFKCNQCNPCKVAESLDRLTATVSAEPTDG